MLVRARLTVAIVPFKRWRRSLGGAPGWRTHRVKAIRFAAHVEWAARRLPFTTKCLPRTMALSWILRREKLAHAVVFAVRPEEQRGSADSLHAWVEVADERILGDLPGPWIETARFGN